MIRIIGALIALAVGIWVYADAKKRGYSTLAASLWGLGSFLLLIVFVPLYLIFRNRGRIENKPSDIQRVNHNEVQQDRDSVEHLQDEASSLHHEVGEEREEAKIPEGGFSNEEKQR